MRRLFAVIVLMLAVVGGWFWLSIRPANSAATKTMVVRIESGMSLSQVSSDLQDRHLIRSALAFKLLALVSRQSGNIKAGAFAVTAAQTSSEILSILVGGKSEVISITIPEGYTVKDIDTLLASKGLGEIGDIINCAYTCDFSTFEFLPGSPAGTKEQGIGSRLEGYLFPETYFVSVAEYHPKFFLERMLGTLRKRIVSEYGSEILLKKRTLPDLLTMASLVEEESRHEDERPVVAGILWKRLEAKTLLGVDASLRYVLQKRSEPLTKSDLESDSPYNTRNHRGLPPSPIANPGISAFLAALRPEESSYWYYLHDKDGVIHYAVTNDEHNRNRALYLR